MRKYLKKYNEICAEYKIAIIFIHHITKSEYRKTPRNEAVSGAGAIVQKLRTIIDIRNNQDDDNYKYLTITKGNYLSQEEKKKAYLLSFDEENLLFANTGSRVGIEELSIKSEKAEVIDKALIDFNLIFTKDVMTTQDIKTRCYDLFGYKDRAAMDIISYGCVTNKIYKITKGCYSLKPPKSDENLF
jgi:RecA-family ATPase